MRKILIALTSHYDCFMVRYQMGKWQREQHCLIVWLFDCSIVWLFDCLFFLWDVVVCVWRDGNSKNRTLRNNVPGTCTTLIVLPPNCPTQKSQVPLHTRISALYYFKQQPTPSTDLTCHQLFKGIQKQEKTIKWIQIKTIVCQVHSSIVKKSLIRRLNCQSLYTTLQSTQAIQPWTYLPIEE